MARKKDLFGARRQRVQAARSRSRVAGDDALAELTETLGVERGLLQPLAELRLEEAAQPRVQLDAETLDDYTERMRLDARRGAVVDLEGERWPDLRVFRDHAAQLWLADGFHRVRAARNAGLEVFQATVSPGERRDAILHSLKANARHGKRRTNADKRRAVTSALTDEEWSAYSDQRIAQMCVVTRRFVGKVRKELAEAGAIEPRAERVGVDGHVHRVDPDPSPPEPEPAEADPHVHQLGSAEALDELEPPPDYLILECGDPSQLDRLGPLVEALPVTPGAIMILLKNGASLEPSALGQLGARGRWPSSTMRLVSIQNPPRVALLWSTRTTPPQGVLSDPMALTRPDERIVHLELS